MRQCGRPRPAVDAARSVWPAITAALVASLADALACQIGGCRRHRAEARIGQARRQADRARADMVRTQAKSKHSKPAKQARAEGARKD